MEDNNLETSKEDKKEEKWVHVDQNMIPTKVAYFFQVGKDVLSEYTMLFYMFSGLSPSQAGVVNGMQYVGGFVGNVLWSYVADRKGHHRLIVSFLCFMALITVTMQPFIAWRLPPQPNSCSSNQTSQNSPKLVPENTSLFYTFFVAAILSSSFDSTIGSFVDAGVLLSVRNSPEGRANIGMQRYTGSLGRSFASIMYSVSVQYFPAGAMNCYTGLFLTYSLFNLSTNISSQFLYKGLVMPNKEERKNTNTILWKYIKQIDFFHFFFAVLVNGILQALYFGFIFLYLKTLQAPTIILGFTTTLNTVTGVTVYIFSEKIINALGGSSNAMCFSTFMWTLRFLSTAAISNPYYIFIIAFFHGFSYSLFLVSYLKYVNETTDERICTTICGLANALYKPGSSFLANIVGGILYEKYGAKPLFNGAAAVSVGWAIISVLYIFVRNRIAQDYEQLDNDDGNDNDECNDDNGADNNRVDDEDDDTDGSWFWP